MKKTIAILLALCLCVALCACSGKESKDNDTDTTSNNSKFDFSAVNIGDTITLGTYEQNNITDDGKEPIEWLVLAQEDNRLLVISKYLIDVYHYNSDENSVTWEDSTLRAWLNSSFFEEAFNVDERKIIADTKLFTVGGYQKYYDSFSDRYVLTSKPMPDCRTTDKVFILSVDELELYFENNTKIIAKPTTYARLATRGEYYDPDEWFTRTPGAVVGAQKFVDDDGSYSSGGATNTLYLGVRPCIWIEIDG